MYYYIVIHRRIVRSKQKIPFDQATEIESFNRQIAELGNILDALRNSDFCLRAVESTVEEIALVNLTK